MVAKEIIFQPADRRLVTLNSFSTQEEWHKFLREQVQRLGNYEAEALALREGALGSGRGEASLALIQKEVSHR